MKLPDNENKKITEDKIQTGRTVVNEWVRNNKICQTYAAETYFLDRAIYFKFSPQLGLTRVKILEKII